MSASIEEVVAKMRTGEPVSGVVEQLDTLNVEVVKDPVTGLMTYHPRTIDPEKLPAAYRGIGVGEIKIVAIRVEDHQYECTLILFKDGVEVNRICDTKHARGSGLRLIRRNEESGEWFRVHAILAASGYLDRRKEGL